MDERSTLQEYGLSIKEADAYLALLDLGESSATAVARKTRIDRTLVYHILGKLQEKGLVSYIKKKGVKTYAASEPATLLEGIDEIRHKMALVLPSLEQRKKNSQSMPTVEVYEGRKGLWTIGRDVIRIGEDYLVFGDHSFDSSLLPDLQRFFRMMGKKGIKERILLQYRDRELLSTNSHARFLEYNLLTKTTTLVYGSNIAIFIWSKPYHVVVVRDREVAESYRAYFEALWEMAKD